MSDVFPETLLRVFLRNTLRRSWWSTSADALLRQAIRRGLMGETTLEGVLGFDPSGRIIEPGRWSLVKTRPLILEFFDSQQAIGAFLADVVELVPVGLATLERAHVLAVRRKSAAKSPFNSLSAPLGASSHMPAPEEFPIMRTAVDGHLLRVFVDDTDSHDGKPLYRAVIERARELGLVNAIVLRAPVGFGSHGRVHSNRSPDYGNDIPIVIELVGAPEQVSRLLPFLDEAVGEGLVTLENVKMLTLGAPAQNLEPGTRN